MSRHDHGLARHSSREEITRIRSLALVTEEQPRPAEQPLHLELEHLRIGVDGAMDPIGLDQSCDVVGAERWHCESGRYSIRTRPVFFRTARGTARRGLQHVRLASEAPRPALVI